MTATPIGIRSHTKADADLGRLKRLLLVDERLELDALRADVSRLDERAGSEARFGRAVADSLVAAVKSVEIENHRDLATVMAPLVISAIRREIAESRDMMVETLYPITGRMVAAGIAVMFKQLSDDINAKLETVLSPQRVQLRLKAIITGRAQSDLVLAAAGRGRLERLLLIERATGAVLAATDAEGRAEQGSGNALHLLGGLVSAIVEFAGHALSDVQGELRQLDFGGQVVLLRASPRHILAAITQAGGTVPGLPGIVDSAFLDFVASPRATEPDEAAPMLAQLHHAIAGRILPAPKKGGASPAKVLAVVAGLACAALAWHIAHIWTNARERGRQDASLAAIERAPAVENFPLRLLLDREAGIVRASGILPTDAARDAILAEVARDFPGWPVEARVAVLSETPAARDAEAGLSDLRAGSTSLSTALSAAVASIDRLRSETATDTETVRHDIGVLRKQLETLTAETRATRLDEGTERHRTAELTIAALDDVRRTVATVDRRVDELNGSVLAPLLRQVADLSARFDAPALRLDRAVRGTAVFFDVGDRLLDPAVSERDLRALADALAAVKGTRLRVVGHGDGSGTLAGNVAAAQKRAERVAAQLVSFGVEPARLIVLTTRPEQPISDKVGAGANRRVDFELAYPGE